MYVCAQRVQALAGPHMGRQGINSFLYLHGAYDWNGSPPPEWLPDDNPGVIADSVIEVPPPGNRVRSYLDIVAPDSTPFNHLVHAAGHPGVVDELPATWVSGNVWCRFGTDGALAPQWQHELHRLLARVILLWKKQTPAIGPGIA
jgi:hypothetical protein